jgi:hypothetical protein
MNSGILDPIVMVLVFYACIFSNTPPGPIVDICGIIGHDLLIFLANNLPFFRLSLFYGELNPATLRTVWSLFCAGNYIRPHMDCF